LQLRPLDAVADPRHLHQRLSVDVLRPGIHSPKLTAILASSGIVLLVIAIRSTTIMGFRLGLCGAILPAIAILAVTLLAAIHTRLQGILITGAGIALFIGAMLLLPRFNLDRPPRTALPGALPAGS
jgi:drug/metabolite transporter (DMT)-like permease